jgi:hypothetical protein
MPGALDRDEAEIVYLTQQLGSATAPSRPCTPGCSGWCSRSPASTVSG